MGWLHVCQGDYETAMRIYAEALEILDELHINQLTATIETGMGLALYHLGDYDRSLTRLRQGLETARKIKFRARVAEALILMSMVEIAKERIEIARGYLEEGLASAREIHGLELTTAGLIIKADLERHSGNLAEALGDVEEALGLAGQIDLSVYEMWARTEAGLILISQDCLEAAFEHTWRAVQLIPRANQSWISSEDVRLAHTKTLAVRDAIEASKK
jgi:tetratricopeptide (TPR) repeat protein